MGLNTRRTQRREGRLWQGGVVPLLLSLFLGACRFTQAETQDLWNEVISECDYRIPGGGKLEVTEEDKLSSTLHDGCREALEDILPFDDTWEQAPPGLRDRVLEAFQILAAYPLALPPQNRILGKAPGSIPSAMLCWIGAESCPSSLRPDYAGFEVGNYRRNLFNMVANAFERISFDPDESAKATASNDFDLSAGVIGRTLIIHVGFWDFDPYVDLVTGPFGRAAILVHEAWHSEGSFHSVCPDTGRATCDPSLLGAYGATVVYGTLLMQGSGSTFTPDHQPLLSALDLMGLGYTACEFLKYRIFSLPVELKRDLESTECGSVNARWVVRRERLRRPELR